MFIHEFFIYSWNERFFFKFINSMYNFDFSSILHYFDCKDFLYRCRGSATRVLFLYILFVKSMKMISKESGYHLVDSHQIAYRFIFSLAWVRRNMKLFKTLSRFLSYIFSSLMDFLQPSVHFYLISNEQITADFLSRFIARKFRQGYEIKDLINPIRRELLFLMRFNDFDLKGRRTKHIESFYYRRNFFHFRRSAFKHLL